MKERSTQEILDSINQIVKEHEIKVRWSYMADTDDRIRAVLRHYENVATEGLLAIKHFRDDVVVYLRAVALVADSTAQASTHAEKNARLRGLIETIESALQKLRHEEVDFDCTYWQWPDVFRSDYPTVHLIRRIHELENEIKELKKGDKNECEES